MNDGLRSAIEKLQERIKTDELKIEGLDIDVVLTKQGLPEEEDLEPFDIWYRIEGYYQALEIMQGQVEEDE